MVPTNKWKHELYTNTHLIINYTSSIIYDRLPNRPFKIQPDNHLLKIQSISKLKNKSIITSDELSWVSLRSPKAFETYKHNHIYTKSFKLKHTHTKKKKKKKKGSLNSHADPSNTHRCKIRSIKVPVIRYRSPRRRTLFWSFMNRRWWSRWSNINNP